MGGSPLSLKLLVEIRIQDPSLQCKPGWGHLLKSNQSVPVIQDVLGVFLKSLKRPCGDRGVEKIISTRPRHLGYPAANQCHTLCMNQ